MIYDSKGVHKKDTLNQSDGVSIFNFERSQCVSLRFTVGVEHARYYRQVLNSEVALNIALSRCAGAFFAKKKVNLSANPPKWSNKLKQFVGNSR